MISVIIPSRNAENNIHDLISSLIKQSTPCEIIVIDSSSSDNTIKIAESHGVKTIIINREDFDHGGTRNLAVTHTVGDILVFLTQDALPADKYFLEKLIKPLENPEIPAAYGRQIPKEDAKPPERFARFFNYPETSNVKGRGDISELGIKTFFFSNVCSAVRKKEFEKSGGFTEKLIMNEDMLLAGKLISSGYKIAYVHEAGVIHSHSYSWKQQFQRNFDIGVFLRMYSQTLKYAKPDSAGFLFLKEEVRYLLKNRAYRWLPYVIGEALSKYFGYKLGQHYTRLPNPVRKRLSMHSNYWSTAEKGKGRMARDEG